MTSPQQLIHYISREPLPCKKKQHKRAKKFAFYHSIFFWHLLISPQTLPNPWRKKEIGKNHRATSFLQERQLRHPPNPIGVVLKKLITVQFGGGGHL